MSHSKLAPFQLFDENNAPEPSKPYLTQAKAAFGLVPNVEGVMSQAPALLATYMTGWDKFYESSLDNQEMQIVYQTANFENNCEYCMPWHTILAEQSGLSEHDVEALREGASLQNTKQEALRVFTRDLVRTRGGIAPADLQAFFNAGYSEQQALEVILGLAVKLMSNYTNSIAQTELDGAAVSKSWKKPSLRAK